ncbi:glycosyltransferase family A protein [Viridibacterium curvum]|uniref:Glycosyltransferase 2-like domain-containing protein n=1 Tax=Viridibacterium curvum TaxID=1101404 RepID=A0ABP9QLU9_9RHOO
MAERIADVAVIIPMLNEAETLPFLLRDLAAQTVRPRELLFSDAGSSDGSARIVSAWWEAAAWEGGSCQVLSSPGALPGGGRNRGLAQCTARRIAFIDAGLGLSPEWLEEMLEALDGSDGLDAIYAQCRFQGTGVLGAALCGLSYGQGAERPALVGSLFKQEAVRRSGLFAEHLRAGEDLRWTKGFDAAGGKRGRAPRALIHYMFFPPSFAAAIRKWRVYEKYAVLAGVGGRSRLLSCLLLAMGVAGVVIPAAWFLGVLYLLGRGVADPLRRSDRRLWLSSPAAVALALLLAPALDVAKLWGGIQGCVARFSGAASRVGES